MKRLFTLALLLSIITSVFAQTKLSSSRTSGYYTYIYKLTDPETFKIASESKSVIKDDFLHTLVDSFYVDQKKRVARKLPYGNYLYVTAVKNELVYRLEPVSNVNLQFVNNNKDFQFAVTDVKGNLIPDAEVILGKGKKVKYDQKSKLYITGFKPGETVITVKYKGLSSYFTHDADDEDDDYKPYKKPFSFKRFFNSVLGLNTQSTPKYTGYMVFNKPKYKPLDTVKFKAYLVTKKGKAIYNKPLQVELQTESGNANKILTTLNPYREGGYEYSFLLADSLNLKLDRNYTIYLKEKDGKDWKSVYSKGFNYEDYELKSVNFSVRTDQQEHRPGSPVVFYMKGTDENDLAVPDGRVEVFVRANHVSKFYTDQIFVRDSLWRTDLKLDPTGETKLILPDSIFPKTNLNFTVDFTFLNSNNERRTESKSLSYLYENKVIKTSFKKDSLYIDYQVDGKSIPEKAKITTAYINRDDEDSVMVLLPAAIKVDYTANDYFIKTANGFTESVFMDDFDPTLTVGGFRTKDSLQVTVGNEHKIPFWYTVFSGDQVILRGYTNTLDTSVKYTSSKIAYVKISYFWDEEERRAETSIGYASTFLNVQLVAPQVVYPGQTVNMKVKVSDVDLKPIPGTDVTAFAYTSKFNTSSSVRLPYFGKNYRIRKQKPIVETDDVSTSGSMELNWDKWGKELNLDTIEYYKFSQTRDLYEMQEDAKDAMTVVAPFVVKDGKMVPVHVVYIDEVPVFFDQAHQLKRYAFKIQPGMHTIRLRTSGNMLTLNNYKFAEGKKTILSIAADVVNPKAQVTIAPDSLTDHEASELTKYMIRITDNFMNERSVITAGSVSHLLNPPPFRTGESDLLVGPFQENYLNIAYGSIRENFIKEPGYTYTFLPKLLKQKSYSSKFGFTTKFDNKQQQYLDYKEYPLVSGEIDHIWNEYLNLRSRTTILFRNYGSYTPTSGRLMMELDTAIANKMPYVKNILIYKYDDPAFLKIWRGSDSDFLSLEQGKYRVLYLFKDNRYFIQEPVEIKRNGVNYFKWSVVNIKPADRLSIDIDQQIKSVDIGRSSEYFVGETIIENLNKTYFDPSMLIYKMSGRVIDGKDKTPLWGATVKIRGLNRIVTADEKGEFEIRVPKNGRIVISYLGYDSHEVVVHNGNVGEIPLRQMSNSLNEVVVVGYGTQKKESLTGSITTISQNLSGMLAGRVAGVSVKSFSEASFMIRGINSTSAKKPLVIVDGIPYDGDVSGLDASLIGEISILKDADATAIYGSRGANGVIIVKTKSGNMQATATGELVTQQQTMRTNFSDYAIWQPKLLTDENGIAEFTVKFPDDITNWTTRLIAMNGKKQNGQHETSIKSFKNLSANFVSPQFAIIGDSIRVIGKLMNYNPFEESVTRKFSYNDLEILNGLKKIKNAVIDTMAIVAKSIGNPSNADSLKFEYTLKKDNGYFDGEIRKIPLLQAGVLETKGYFDALLRDTAVTYNFDASLGKVTLHAEASVFPVLLDEIEKLKRYEYLCNEQIASKLKSLLLEKTVRSYLGESFKEEKNIKELIKKLQNNKRPEGTWGWWQNSNEEIWISLHVVEALLQAQKQGYAVTLNKDQLYNYLVNKLADRKNIDQIHAVRLLNLLNDKYYIKDWVTAIEQQTAQREKAAAVEQQRYPERKPVYKTPLYDQLQMMQLRQKAGMAVDIKWLLDLKKSTMFGNSYWGEELNQFWDNSIQNTLLAYQILKAERKYNNELDRILRYFLEQRKDGQWRNTYESSLILETILPDLMISRQRPEPPSISLNHTEKVTVFPYHKTIEPAKLIVEKNGNAPVYFTAYQQFNNPKPAKVSKEFTVTTAFNQNGTVVRQLKAGVLTNLKVNVTVSADADYVMIEIPIPAGCSYENKMTSFWGIETHREYFKHKTSIFCTKLKKGEYTFNIQLMPRYSGNYVLNPAKAEMMYFPVFYGREGLKRVTVN
ncbi:carboxypeptidase-like regulatory domain-containing protein [Pedobacter metabolipauper]|uniref:TonB-dependent SusC/RagA subfamily outer membrane receptor n=1 Tax=Pedobacter metabolipauper TaxID=425513 RepID=A0A4V3D107_9SPHI|nr:carboxypeptidase-like regulatory domain-containing protein [Pedobacter metabolipauper]TDQ08514.1 TonB-dependent SusC/RagA subfamily outer membrane receptor [Pedobacter metabolipauper]